VTASPGDRQLRRIERDTLIVGGVLAASALAVWPSQPGRAAGVAGGVLLIALSYQGIRAGVDAVWAPPAGSVDSASSPAAHARPRLGFVKFFTRHAILAVSAYVMMARFEFDPMAMLAGVTAPAVAASIESVRIMRARSSGSHSRLS